HRVHADAYHSIASIHDLAFARDENTIAFNEEHLLRFTRPVRKSEEFQSDRRRRTRASHVAWILVAMPIRTIRGIGCDLALLRLRQYRDFWRLASALEDVPTLPSVLRLFACLQNVGTDGGIEGLR